MYSEYPPWQNPRRNPRPAPLPEQTAPGGQPLPPLPDTAYPPDATPLDPPQRIGDLAHIDVRRIPGRWWWERSWRWTISTSTGIYRGWTWTSAGAWHIAHRLAAALDATLQERR